MTVIRIYRPRHIKEHLSIGGKLYSCTESAAAMGADAVSIGATVVTQEYVRAHTSEPVPDPQSPGLTIPQVLKVLRGDLKQAGWFDATGHDWEYLWDGLTHDRRIILQCRMDLLHSCANGNVGHAILLQAYRKGRGVLVNDPMCTKARWLTPQDVKAAAEAFGKSTGLASGGLRFAVSKKVPRVAVG